ncbi:MAG: Ig-like domain-containing protein, partial [Treponema sp.]|nr:Ig-like domain-containing protein [Treponema sp.]
MKDMLFRRMARGCFLLVTLLFLLPGCKQSDSWEEPVAEYFDKYTNTAAIEKHEISCGYEKDAGGTSCISSYGNKTVSFYLRNPRNYNLLTSFSTLDSEVTVSQSTSDKSVIYVTYPETYLIANDCGGSIGGTISLQEEETLREFESYTFSLKCNTPPPSVKGPMVNAAGGKYIVCFYMPTTELGSQRHSASSHKLFINNALVCEGSPSELMAAYASRPSNLAALQGGTLFSTTTPSGCTAFYYETGVDVQGGKILSWSIRIEDGEGLSSKTMKASSDVRDVNLTLTGGEVFAQGDASQTFTASTDEGEVLGWSWSSSDESVVTVSGTNNGNSTSGTVDIVGGGTATVTAQAELSDGRILTRQKEVRVLGISFNETQRDFLKGQTDTSLSASLAGFPDGQTCTWTSSNSSVASINSSSGALSLSAKGKSTITVSATYGGRTVSKTKEIVVHEVKINGASEVFTGSGNTLSLTAAVDSPSGASAPTGIGYEWSSSAPGKAT